MSKMKLRRSVPATPETSPFHFVRASNAEIVSILDKHGLLKKATPVLRRKGIISDQEPEESDENTEPEVPQEEIFKGVVAYVEVRSGRTDVSDVFMTRMAAAGSELATSITRKVTHVVFKEGKLSTFKKASQRKIPIVNVLWVVECLKTNRRLPTGEFLAEDPEIERQTKVDNQLNVSSPLTIGNLHTTRKATNRKRLFSTNDAVVGQRKEEEKHKRRKRYTHLTDVLLNRRDSEEDFKVRKKSFQPAQPICSKPKLLNLNCGNPQDSHYQEVTSQSAVHSQGNSVPVDGCENKPTSGGFSLEKGCEKLTETAVLPSICNNSLKERRKLHSMGTFCGVDGPDILSNGCGVSDQAPSKLTKSKHTEVKRNCRKEKSCVKTDSRTLRLAEKATVNECTVPAGQENQDTGKNNCPDVDLPEQSERNFPSLVENCAIDSASASRRKSNLGKHVNSNQSKTQKIRSGVVSSQQKTLPTLVITSCEIRDRELIEEVVSQLGGFQLSEEVISSTTHLVSGAKKRTLSMLLAIAQGCWVLPPEWVFKSLESGKWLEEEPFELNEYFPAIRISRMAQQSRLAESGKPGENLFSSLGQFFLEANCTVPLEKLSRLISLLGGKVVNSSRQSTIIVSDSQNSSRKNDSRIQIVSSKWILDCISQYQILPLK